MVQKPIPHRIQKTTVFIVIALATLGAVGVMTTMMTSATTAEAAPSCHASPNGAVVVCPPGSGVFQPFVLSPDPSPFPRNIGP